MDERKVKKIEKRVRDFKRAIALIRASKLQPELPLKLAPKKRER